jgi:hypothetical protein
MAGFRHTVLRVNEMALLIIVFHDLFGGAKLSTITMARMLDLTLVHG